MFLSILIFVLVYACVISEKVNKTIAALIGAGAVLMLHLLPYEKAIEAVDMNVIFLLVGMMTTVYVLSQTGFFEWIAISIAKTLKGRPLPILLMLLAATAFLSAFLDNVTTIVLIAPVTILITKILEIEAIPFLILEALASNIGGTATLIGDPPNIIIGSQAGLSFTDFIVHLTPSTVLIMGVFLGIVFFMNRTRFHVPDNVRLRVTEAVPSLAIVDYPKMKRTLCVLGLIFIGFFLHDHFDIQPGIVALTGSVILLLVNREEEVEGPLQEVEWGVLFFFIGLFILIAALEYNGVIEFLAEGMLRFSGESLLISCMVLLWGSALVSSILDNIPIVMALIPMVRLFISHYSGTMGVSDPALIQTQIADPLWWSLTLGACLGGNGTLIGASANVVVARIGEKNNAPVTFMRFFKYGFPYMLLSLVIASLYVWGRYFVAGF